MPATCATSMARWEYPGPFDQIDAVALTGVWAQQENVNLQLLGVGATPICKMIDHRPLLHPALHADCLCAWSVSNVYLVTTAQYSLRDSMLKYRKRDPDLARQLTRRRGLVLRLSPHAMQAGPANMSARPAGRQYQTGIRRGRAVRYAYA